MGIINYKNNGKLKNLTEVLQSSEVLCYLPIECNNLNLVHCAIKIKQLIRKGFRYYKTQPTEFWDSFKQSL